MTVSPDAPGGQLPVTVQVIYEILEPLRQGFQADGADLVVDKASEDLVEVRLVVTDRTCLECISPTRVLTRILESAIRERLPRVNHFSFSDPR